MAYYSGEVAHTSLQHSHIPTTSRDPPSPYYGAHIYQQPAVSYGKEHFSHHMGKKIHIQPDLLPSHSNPQDLSPNQKLAFADSMSCAPVILSKGGVSDNQTGARVLAITKEAVHFPSFLSSKPLLTVTRCNTGVPVGTIRFHHLTTSDIQLSINGCETVLTGSRLHKHWSFRPTSLPMSLPDVKGKAKPWFWKRDKIFGHSMVLVDSRKAKVHIARIAGNMLIFEKPGLSNETLDDIIMTAVALSESARRRSKSGDVMDLGFAIGDLAGGSSGGHGGAHHSSHGSSGGAAHHGGFFGMGDGGGGCSGGDGGGGSGGGGGGDGGGGGGGGGGC